MTRFNLIPRDPWEGIGWAWTWTPGVTRLICTIGPYTLRVARAGAGRVGVQVWVTQ